jgi:hypothetical protein
MDSPTTLSSTSSSPTHASPTFHTLTLKPKSPSSNVDFSYEYDSTMSIGVTVDRGSAVIIVIGLFVFAKENIICHTTITKSFVVTKNN